MEAANEGYFTILTTLYSELCLYGSCLGSECLNAHKVHEIRRPIFDTDGLLAYCDFPCSYYYYDGH